MTDSVIDGLFFYLTLCVVGWIYFLGGLFEYCVYAYKLYPIEALELFDVFGQFHQKLIATLFMSVGRWQFNDEQLLADFNRAARTGAIICMLLSSMSMALLASNFRRRFLDANTLFEQLNYGFWLMLMLLTVFLVIRVAWKLVRLHKTLQGDILAYSPIENGD